MKYFCRTQNQTLRYRNIRNNVFMVHCISSTVVKNKKIGKHHCALLYSIQSRSKLVIPPLFQLLIVFLTILFKWCFLKTDFYKKSVVFSTTVLFFVSFLFQMTSCTVLRVENKLSWKSFSPANYCYSTVPLWNVLTL